jgi:Mg2+ and Co2+ transporter CorA
MAVRSALLFRAGGSEPTVVDPASVARPRSDRELLWVDVDAATDDAAGLGPLAEAMGIAEGLNALPTDGRPMVRFRDSALVIQVRALTRHGTRVESVPLLIIGGPNVVLSVHKEHIRHLEEPVHVFAADPRFGHLDAGTFAGLLLDGVIDGYLDEVEAIERVIDELDARALTDRDVAPLLDELVDVRGRIAGLRRTISPHQEVFAALSRPVEGATERSAIGWPWPGLPARLDRALDAVENVREQLVGTFDLVMTRTSEHTNDVMRMLTVISAVLLPSVVIAGVMGMNFRVPLFEEPSNFLLVVGAMVALAVTILAFARWRRWI